jgi:hypothetical protein
MNEAKVAEFVEEQRAKLRPGDYVPLYLRDDPPPFAPSAEQVWLRVQTKAGRSRAAPSPRKATREEKVSRGAQVQRALWALKRANKARAALGR